MRRGKLPGTLVWAGLLAAWLAGCSAGAGGGADREEAEANDNRMAMEEETQESETAAKQPETAVSDSAEPQDLVEEEKGSALEGLGLSIVGDSISAFDGWIPNGFHVFYPLDGEVKDVSQTWWKMLLDDTGMELCCNNSSAGSTCAGDSLAQEDAVWYGCSSFRLSFMSGSQGRMPDVIIVYMGTNDLLNGIPLGDNDGTRLVEEGEIDNFSDAYCMMLDKLSSEYPMAQIYCCTLTPVGEWASPQPFVALTNGLGLSAEDYSEQIRVVAEGKGIPVIDLYHCGIEVDNLQTMTSDGVHPTPDGMKYIERAMLAAISGDVEERGEER